MHKEILSQEQLELLPLVSRFKKDFYMVGGTAIALQIGHRYSIDFDLFTYKPIKIVASKKIINDFSVSPKRLIAQSSDQIHYNLNGVKLTLFQFPFEINAEVNFDKIISMPTLLSLAAMKAFALGGRAKWKDYVDLYFLLKFHFNFSEISQEAQKLFSESSFSSKLFREQLSFFDDINYEEKVDFLPGFETSEEEIKKFLIEVATEPF